MTEADNTESDGSIPLAVKKTPKERGFSPIWIIPIVALLIGLFLIYRVISESGPTITISFNAASGIEAGKTKVKFKDVNVGEVTKVDIDEDLSGVTITLSMVSNTSEYMTDKSRFWIVQPEISAGTITGLGTLLSGNYIAMDPSSEGKETKKFTGLEDPPVIHSNENGSGFKLRAKELGGLKSGSAVFFRQIAVGSVVDYRFHDSGDIELDVFIEAPYDKHVNNATRFYNAGGFDITLSAAGLEIKTQSLITIIAGGIAFDTVESLGLDSSQPAAKGKMFQLYPSRTASQNKIYTVKNKVLMYFDDPVRGLLPGAPVELRGYKIGEVLDISFEFDRETGEVRLPVLVELEPQRVKITGDAHFDDTLEQLVAKGLRASLRSGNIVFGKLLVDLEFYPDGPPAKVDFSGKYPAIPTIRGGVGAIMRDAQALVAELRQTVSSINDFLESESFKDSAANLSATLGHIEQISAQINEEAGPQVTAVLSSAASTLEEAQSMLAANSTTRTDINRVLQELAAAARSIRLLADYLEQHPEAIIKGKER